MPMHELFSARRLYVLAVLLVVVAMASALYLQYAIGLAPCPLCVIQRMGYVAAAIDFLHWTLVTQGAKANYTLFGDLVR
jgi:disulfide bond formation protein DsbB